MNITHTEIGWIIFAVAVVGSLFSSVPAQPPVVTVPVEPSEPDNTGAIEAPEPVLAVDKPSDAPRSVTVEASGACSDGSCGTQRRGFLGLFRGRR